MTTLVRLETALRVEGLAVSFGEVEALRGISFAAKTYPRAIL